MPSIESVLSKTRPCKQEVQWLEDNPMQWEQGFGHSS